MATRDKPLKDLVGVWPIFGYKFWIQILHSDLERGEILVTQINRRFWPEGSAEMPCEMLPIRSLRSKLHIYKNQVKGSFVP